MQDLKNGIYEKVISEAFEVALNDFRSKGGNVDEDTIPDDSKEEILSRYVQEVLKKGLTIIKETSKKDESSLTKEIEVCNEIIELLSKTSDTKEILDWKIGMEGKRLLSIWENNKPHITKRPKTSLTISSLFTGGESTISLSSELENEIESSDEINFLVSFIKYSGIRLIIDSLRRFTMNGGKLRIITTTYMGATDPEAIRLLSGLPNTEIKISFDSKNTRLHAKSYMFKRDSGFHSVFIGSSNLSSAAVSDGLEWNIKLTNEDAPYIIDAAMKTFNIYWDNPDFKTYRDGDYEEIRKILAKENSREKDDFSLSFFDLRPYPYQQEILDKLEAERNVHGRFRNLVVAATGTGKTMVSAFDYKRFRQQHPGEKNRLLFIAHRKEILKQSLYAFRNVLRDNNFGEMYVGGYVPKEIDYLFMSVQTFNSRDFRSLPADYYDYIVVDETHHGAARSYQDLLTYFKPKVLLGMTATPERTDGHSLLDYFDGVYACEIRLSDAINRGLLSPFHYFAVTDHTDISRVKFEAGKYDTAELSSVYEGNDSRVQLILDSLSKYKPNIDSIKGLGFCVSKEHARYMSDSFNSRGIPSINLTADSDQETRDNARYKLENGEIKFIFVVDLYNEGVDIPSINLELMLRPTESKIVFIQQLGRGLRKCDDKTELTVLDFVSQFNKKYHVYEEKLKYMTSMNQKTLETKIKEGFPGLPMGCHIHLEEVSKDYILKGIDDSPREKYFIDNVKEMYEQDGIYPTLSKFVEHMDGIDPRVIYKRSTYTHILKKAKDPEYVPTEDENKMDDYFRKGLLRACGIDSKTWIESIRDFMSGDRSSDEKTELFASMLMYTFNDKWDGDSWTFIDFLRNSKYADEFMDLLSINYEKIDFVSVHQDLKDRKLPFDVHCTYSKNQILSGLGLSKRIGNFREGVLSDPDKTFDVLFVDLNKSEKDYSPTTMYEDYPINSNLFHWQSQSLTSEDSVVGRRYINHDMNGSSVLLFVRERKKDAFGTPPFVFLGKAHYRSHEGSRPMSIKWEMEEPIPQKVMNWSAVAKG